MSKTKTSSAASTKKGGKAKGAPAPAAPAAETPRGKGGKRKGEAEAPVAAIPATVPVQAEPLAAAPAEPAKAGKRLAKGKADNPKKVGALDAAARLLGEAGRSMTCQEMIDGMAAKGYWTTPGGKTPAATLYSAILREMNVKGDAARFAKTSRGQFGLKSEGK